jgi:cytochrome c oxidase assembly protein subunit 15
LSVRDDLYRCSTQTGQGDSILGGQNGGSETLSAQSAQLASAVISKNQTLCLQSSHLELAVISMPLKLWSMFMTVAIYSQILLGGLVASHFASLVCTDFPTCHGQWFPTFSGIIGLHVIHRLGAYTIFALALLNLVWLWRKPQLHKPGTWIFGLVCAQVGIGIANVMLLTPPLIAVAHLTVATAILGFTLVQNRMVWVNR